MKTSRFSNFALLLFTSSRNSTFGPGSVPYENQGHDVSLLQFQNVGKLDHGERVDLSGMSFITRSQYDLLPETLVLKKLFKVRESKLDCFAQNSVH